MNKLIKVLLNVAGKESMEIDPSVNNRRIVRLCWAYGWMIIRGRIRAKGSISRNIFIGKNVKLVEKKQMCIGAKTRLHDNVKIDALSINGVQIGDNVILGKGTVIECTGSLEHLGKGLTIGDRSTFGNDCFFGAAGGIEIGSDVVAGQFIRFHSENHNFDDLSMLIRDQGVSHKGITIGNNCWIGAGSVFLDGSELGDGCVVAANAVVTKKFEENSVIGGVPAKLIKKRGE